MASAGIAVGGGMRYAVATTCAGCCSMVLVIDCWSAVYDSKLTRRKPMCASNCCLRAAMVSSW